LGFSPPRPRGNPEKEDLLRVPFWEWRTILELSPLDWPRRSQRVRRHETESRSELRSEPSHQARPTTTATAGTLKTLADAWYIAKGRDLAGLEGKLLGLCCSHGGGNACELFDKLFKHVSGKKIGKTAASSGSPLASILRACRERRAVLADAAKQVGRAASSAAARATTRRTSGTSRQARQDQPGLRGATRSR